ncbi:hypothetical protein [Robertmurraya sp. FSL R5-0851]|uniref:hypothetical protein n=1 Tax=Robertmurraya sp. FSL R5-0851 TaxID=2921584 RepID=UPI0030F6CCB2
MPKQKLTIVPVSLHAENKDFVTPTSPTPSNSVCTIKTANVEISFFNGVDERIIQAVMRELKSNEA